MPEEALCKLGRSPKILSYIDEKEKRYVQLNCKLKDEINTMQLHYFFNKIYSMKLDMGYANTFKENYSTYNLIECFKAILIEHEVINLQEIYIILNKEQSLSWTPVEYAIKEFFNMFEVLEIHYYPIVEYNIMLRKDSLNPLFSQQKSNFSKEIVAMQYNSQFIKVEELDNSKVTEQVGTNKESPKQTAKIKVKKLAPSCKRKIS